MRSMCGVGSMVRRWLGSAPGVEISCHPVTTRVGNTRHDDSELIMPVEIDVLAQGQTGELFPDG